MRTPWSTPSRGSGRQPTGSSGRSTTSSASPSPATPTCAGSCSPTTGSATRCARTTRRPAASTASPTCVRTRSSSCAASTSCASPSTSSSIRPLPLPRPRRAPGARARRRDAPRSIRPAGGSEGLEDKDMSKLVLRRVDRNNEEMLINFGPQHPSTHGVLNFLVETDGEVMRKAIPDIGYLHRSLEKIGEMRRLPRVHALHRPHRLPRRDVRQRGVRHGGGEAPQGARSRRGPATCASSPAS